MMNAENIQLINNIDPVQLIKEIVKKSIKR